MLIGKETLRLYGNNFLNVTCIELAPTKRSSVLTGCEPYYVFEGSGKMTLVVKAGSHGYVGE